MRLPQGSVWRRGAIGLALVLQAACTGSVDPVESPEAIEEGTPSVASGSDARRTIYLWDPETGDAEALVSATAQATGLGNAERSPDGTRVVYEHQVLAGPTQIYVLEADGMVRPLTDLAGGAHDPAWSPDGRSIAFSGSKAGGSDLDIYTVDLADGEVHRLAGGRKDDQHPDWSPDGTQIVFDARSGDPGDLRSGRGEIWVASVRTGDLDRLTPQRTPLAATAPAWSPDGRWIAYREYARWETINDWPYKAWLQLIRPDGSRVREVKVPRGGGRPLQEPSWSPDGRSIVVERSDPFEREFVVLLVDPTTGEMHEITKPVRHATEPSWGTDGILLTLWDDEPVPSDPAPRAFHLAADSVPSATDAEPLVELGAGYYFVDVRTGEASRLSEAFRSIEGAADYEVSPDGSMILFENSGRTTPSNKPPDLGHHQLYVANVDGTGLRQLTDDPVGASQGSWSPDGTRVVYLGGWAKLCCWDSPAHLKVLDLATGTTTTMASGRARPFYDPSFSPDGKAIMFTRYHFDDPHDQYDLWSIPVGGGHPTRVLDDLGYGTSFSSDRTTILYQRSATAWGVGHRCASGYGVAWISDADRNRPRLLVPRAGEEQPRGSSAAAGWSPDGTRIAYQADLAPPDGCSLDSGSGAYVMNMETGAWKLIAFGEPIDWLDDRTLLINAEV